MSVLDLCNFASRVDCQSTDARPGYFGKSILGGYIGIRKIGEDLLQIRSGTDNDVNGVNLIGTGAFDATLLGCGDAYDTPFAMRLALNTVANSVCLTEFVYLIGRNLVTAFLRYFAICCQYR